MCKVGWIVVFYQGLDDGIAQILSNASGAGNTPGSNNLFAATSINIHADAFVSPLRNDNVDASESAPSPLFTTLTALSASLV